MNLDSRIFFDKEISVDPIADKKIAVIGYGNQGRAQAVSYTHLTLPTNREV